MFKKLIPIISAFALALLASGCIEEKYNFRLSDDPGYVENPVLSIKALDGDKWIDGLIDNEQRTITFQFHNLERLNNVLLDVTLDPEWATMSSPAATKFQANLSGGYKFTVNDGVDDISYIVDGSIISLIGSVKATLGGETIECTASNEIYSGAFSTAFLNSDLVGVDLDITLDPNGELVTDEASFKGVDFSDGEAFEVVVKDKTTDRKKTYYIYTSPSDVITLSEDWQEVTKQWQKDYGIAFGNMRMYKTSSLLGSNGNEAYVLTVPAGRVGMKVLEKNGDNNFKTSRTVRENRDYTLFVPQNCPGTWRIGTAAAYYSPLAYGPDSKGVTKVLRDDGFGGTTKMYAPAMALKDGCVSIKPAGTNGGKLYYYSDTKGSNPTEWTDPECAFGGIFFCVKDGANLVSAEGDRYYATYNEEWRAIQNLSNDVNYTWQPCTIMLNDAQKNARLSIGCTAKGDLVLFSCVKVVNTHNQGQNYDLGQDGKSSDKKGVTFYQLGSIMAGFGCSDAMTLDDPAYTYFVLQDGSSRGKDLFPVNNRWIFKNDLSTPITTMKGEDAEYTDLVITCFR